MKKLEYILYFVMTLAFFVTLGFVFYAEDRFEKTKPFTDPRQQELAIQKKASLDAEKVPVLDSIRNELKTNLKNPLTLLLTQLIVVLSIARIFSILFKKMGQPSVIGEIFAGIALGPSFLGLFFPEINEFVFPASSMNNLKILSQMGLILFMFTIGMELDIAVLKQKASSAVLISHASIIFPFVLGIILSQFLFDAFAPEGVSFLSFGLFMGIAMSITAFPVLARIIQEKKITKTLLGSMAITCAAVDDITAWCMLAIIIAIVQAGTIYIAIATLLFSLLFIVFMINVTQPLLSRMSQVYITREYIGKGVLTSLVLILLGSSIITETIGIHALFGAFLAGVIMPSNTNLRSVLTEKFEEFSTVLLLPLFFAFTGLRTQIGLLNDFSLWGVTFVIIIVAIAGKLGGGSIAARLTGMNWKDSLSIGILMNTRGLMELIVLNIGYDLGVITPTIFVMMVLMALFTTITTGPMLKITLENKDSAPETEFKESQVLITFGPTRSGLCLLNLASGIAGKNSNIAALHLSPIPDHFSLHDTQYYQNQNFSELDDLARAKDVNLKKLLKLTDNVTEEILNTVKTENPPLLLMGAAKRVFSDNIIGGKVESVLNTADCQVGIVVDKGIKSLQSVAIFHYDPIEAIHLYHIGGMIYKNTTHSVKIFHRSEVNPEIRLLKTHFGKVVPTVSYEESSMNELNRYSLILIGYKHWMDLKQNPEKRIINGEDIFLKLETSLLILRG